jgi:hypothetical protein
MKGVWQAKENRLICEWCDVGELPRYNPALIQMFSDDVCSDILLPSVLDLMTGSPFGGREWYRF